MTTNYEYALAACDVTDKHALQSYRDKRSLWLSWIDTDEHHAIWKVLYSMIWTDASFRALTQLAVNDESSGLHNTLLIEALINGHIATQVLAIRRLVDSKKTGIISLRKLVNDLKKHISLFTRENYVCFDGLPFDYAVIQHNEMMMIHAGKCAYWGATSGPTSHSTSSMAHAQFDRLAGIDPAKRSRNDRLPKSLLTALEKWLADSGANELAEWSHTYLAHAGGPESRTKIAALTVTTKKITEAIKALARVTEAISAWLLFAGGRSGSLMPIAQFNPFEKLDKPIMRAGGESDALNFWRHLCDERDHYLDGVGVELIQSMTKGH